MYFMLIIILKDVKKKKKTIQQSTNTNIDLDLGSNGTHWTSRRESREVQQLLKDAEQNRDKYDENSMKMVDLKVKIFYVDFLQTVQNILN